MHLLLDLLICYICIYQIFAYAMYPFELFPFGVYVYAYNMLYEYNVYHLE